ncbi:uncharacterized protein Dwil_GK15607 [Drosophila willistoni]|uniref:Protein TsetseEP domain-containing protein n=1 Tax=Drosophila willistoni TaxID=7260 RepID=B4MS99_DROWI|nr:uncharacterized protein LOC6640744 [Drosophila willistoni]EDW74988.1 uncharacterized protein Dwil_GK15607 [Drosophila willistoni]
MLKNISVFFVILYLSLNLNTIQAAIEPLDEYVTQNIRQYNAKLKQYEVEMANFKTTHAKQLSPINVQADQLELKIEEANSLLIPIELIDQWHRQCVLNYSSSIPAIATLRSSLSACASNTADSLMSSPKSTFNTLKSYYDKLPNSVANCEKTHSNSQTNYTTCVTKLITDANTYTVNNQKTFTSYMESSQCTADSRIVAAWQCSFNIVFNTASILSTALRKIEDCVDNRVWCGSLAACKSPNCNTVYFNNAVRQNETIRNPLYNPNSTVSCMEIHFLK